MDIRHVRMTLIIYDTQFTVFSGWFFFQGNPMHIFKMRLCKNPGTG